MELNQYFMEKCQERFAKINSVLCLGLDPVIEKIPLSIDDVEKKLVTFFSQFIDHFHSYALAVKPNIAFYEQYGLSGLIALKKIIQKAQDYQIPVILDAKRGDIGQTSLAYARSVFEEFNADAVTLAPYMGEDSLSPFFSYQKKGFFVLARTSNPGSHDFQLLKIDQELLYQKVCRKILTWNKTYSPQQTAIGAVAGATFPEELRQIACLFKQIETPPPLLIPGVGKQGGSFEQVVKDLKSLAYPLERVFINSSSKILYAYQEHSHLSYLEASLLEIKKMLLAKDG